MPGANPLVEEMPGQVPSAFASEASVSASGLGASVGASAGAALAEPGDNQTHLWVAAIILGALILLVGLHITGFRFATDIGVTGR